MDNSFTHKWIPRIDQQEKNLFVEEYYSSTDTQIKMDDEEQTEIGYITYSVQEQLKPLYGYASRTFDDVAIGNRIVTGMFTVSIKNPEIQTPLADIIASQDLNNGDYSSYNDTQSELQNAIEWITGNMGGYDNSYTYETDDEVFAYSEKLNSLGYKYDNANNPGQSITQQIKEFQSQNKDKLEVNGILTNETKQAIDEAITKSNLPKIKLPIGTIIYSGPAETFDVVTTLKTNQEAYIVYQTDDGWAQIMLPDNTEGYININTV